jgi:hypothetical protein
VALVVFDCGLELPISRVMSLSVTTLGHKRWDTRPRGEDCDGEQEDRCPARCLRASLPRARPPARRHRLHRSRQHRLEAGSLRQSNCACHADPPRLHGPYWHVTRTIDGKTVNRRLTPEQAGLYSEWINNDRLAKELLARMREAAAKATELLLNEAIVQQDRTGPEVRGDAQRRTSDRSTAQWFTTLKLRAG